MELIAQRIDEAGDESLGSAIEQCIVGQQLRVLEEDIFQTPVLWSEYWFRYDDGRFNLPTVLQWLHTCGQQLALRAASLRQAAEELGQWRPRQQDTNLDKPGQRILERRRRLFIAALEQLPRSDYARGLSWLPLEKLPGHVGIIVSASSDGDDVAGAVQKRLDVEHCAKLEPLPFDDAGRILNLWLEDARRTLQDSQRETLLHSFEPSGLPLHLRLAFEQARL